MRHSVKYLHSSFQRSAANAAVLLAFLAPLAASGLAAAQSAPELKVPRTLPEQPPKAPAPPEAPAPVFTDTTREAALAVAPARAPFSTVPAFPTDRLPAHEAKVYSSGPDKQGALWARGTTWKARFDTSGTRFIPILDPCAPRSYPIDFTILSIEVGGERLDFDEAAAPRMAGTRVTFDRGSFVERYDLSVESIEQSLVFESLPPAMASGGDLVIRIGAGSELSRARLGDGLEFQNEHGRVSYGKAIVLDADGRSCGAGPELADDVVELRVPASFLATATFPLVVDPVVSTFSIDMSFLSNFRPDVAYDVSTNRYLVVYEEQVDALDHDVYSMLLDGNGGVVTSGYIDLTTDYWSNPHVANNNSANQFLVVGEASIGNSPPHLIAGAFVTAAGGYGNQFDISDTVESGDKLNPVVGGDPTTLPPTFYCVAWERVFSASDRDIHFKLVRTDGSLATNTRYVDNSGNTYDIHPAISRSNGQAPVSTQRWNVVWERDPGAGRDIRGAQIGWDGTVVTSSFQIAAVPGEDCEPSVSSLHDAFSGERDWLVAYKHPMSGDSDVILKSLRGGTVLGTSNLSALEQVAGSGTLLEDQTRPFVDSDGSKFVIAYSESINRSQMDFNVYVATADIVGSTPVLTEAHRFLATMIGYQGANARITTTHSGGGGRTRAMIAWENWVTSNDGDIQGALYDAPKFQLFCFPNGDTMACPCGNAPSGPGRGCNNSANTGGGVLSATGSPETDTVTFQATQMKPTTSCAFLQGSGLNMNGVAFGDGIRCLSGMLKRLYTKSATTGFAFAPQGGDPSVKTRSAALGDVIQPGSTRWYQVWYRDPANYACSSPATSNATSGIVIDWP